jgi:hypothetical protein
VPKSHRPGALVGVVRADGATPDATQQRAPLQRIEVFADGHGGDAETLHEIVDHHAAARLQLEQDRLLPGVLVKSSH